MTGLGGVSTLGSFHTSMISLELPVTLALTLLAVLFPGFGENTFRKAERLLTNFARRETLAIVVLFLAVVTVRLAVLPRVHVPIPGIHDEFSYLLLADTFAHGRLANPPHPMWVSFETFHVNWLPTYSSMYPPAQGVALAFGQLLGHPWIGVLFSDALMCAAILWMLQAWMPARWAFLGATLAALKFGIASYWMNSYWGGAVAAIGGALVLGALARIVKGARPPDALLLGLGTAILANSRPYEGLLFCIPSAAWFLWWLARRSTSKHPWRSILRQVFLPLSVALIGAATFMAYYNWRLTGNPLLLPYTLNVRTYHTAALFLWQHAHPEIHYRNQQFEDFYNGFEREDYHTNWSDVLQVSKEKRDRFSAAYLWPGLFLVLPAFPFLFRDRKMRLLLVTLALVTLGVFVVVWSNAHYAAPLTCVIYALIVQSMRHLRSMRISGRPIGLAFSRVAVLLLAFDLASDVFYRRCDPVWWLCQGDPSRVAIAEKLQNTPGKHLIVVRYEGDHNIHDEWVYNGADIDAAKVLWAREMDAEQNGKLFAYFQDRKIWLVTPDTDNTYLERYTPPGSNPAPDQ
jgi:hypothetical protein